MGGFATMHAQIRFRKGWYDFPELIAQSQREKENNRASGPVFSFSPYLCVIGSAVTQHSESIGEPLTGGPDP